MLNDILLYITVYDSANFYLCLVYMYVCMHVCIDVCIDVCIYITNRAF